MEPVHKWLQAVACTTKDWSRDSGADHLNSGVRMGVVMEWVGCLEISWELEGEGPERSAPINVTLYHSFRSSRGISGIQTGCRHTASKRPAHSAAGETPHPQYFYVTFISLNKNY